MASLFYKAIFTILFIVSFLAVNAQSVNWTWISGDNSASNAPVYGTKGTAAAANKPGSRDSHSAWKDAAGNFWIFGGMDYTGAYNNDLWKYNVSTGKWTWISGDNATNKNGVYGTKGTAAAANKPGSRQGQTAWSDAAGNFYIYGGQGYDGSGNMGYMNDLWKYDPVAGQWTWIFGDNGVNVAGVYGTKGTAAGTNKPGGRGFITSAKDATGKVWVFGGLSNSGDFNDLWRYDPATNQWTWMSGDNTVNNAGVYGTRGTAAVANKPGSRDSHSGLIDASGNFWIFGGEDGAAGTNVYNDLWKYNISTGQWTWMSGDNTPNNLGVYGTKRTAAAANKPGARAGQILVSDALGNLYVFGGSGYGSVAGKGYLNDLMMYRPSTGNWTWESGDNTVNNGGIFGVLGTGAVSNKSAGRGWGAGWLDAAGNMWVFGGGTTSGDFNDLWRFTSLTILPIQYITLKGTQATETNVLVWDTFSDAVADRFIIERSANGTDFTAIGSVTSNGTGDSRYSFTDNHANAAVYYYRIQVQDAKGQVYYSPVITLASAAVTPVSVYPNPAISSVMIRLTDNSLLNSPARLYDVSGRLLDEIRINSLEQRINLQQFAKGVLTLRLSNGKAIHIVKE
jgi:N-acetylneuraminic acid mutarotase